MLSKCRALKALTHDDSSDIHDHDDECDDDFDSVSDDSVSVSESDSAAVSDSQLLHLEIESMNDKDCRSIIYQIICQ